MDWAECFVSNTSSVLGFDCEAAEGSGRQSLTPSAWLHIDERGSLWDRGDSCGLTGHQLIVRGRRSSVLCLHDNGTVPAHSHIQV